MVAELLDVSHRDGNIAALTGVSLALQAGQVTALLGPDGAGTARNYLSEAVGKLGGRNKVDAARIARAKGWL